MNNLEMRILCGDCPKLKSNIVDSGRKYGVEYVILKSDKRYIIVDNPDISWDDIMKNRIKDFVTRYVPKFGKFEIEEYLSYAMLEAIIFTKDITNLFNSELLCFDLPYNVTRVSSDSIKNKMLKCFDVVSQSEDEIRLMFKWEYYCNLE